MDIEEFCSEFEKLLEKADKIDAYLIYMTSNIIRTKMKEINKEKMVRIGPCIECNKDINYLPLSPTHRKQGDKFLDKLNERYKKFKDKVNEKFDKDKDADLVDASKLYKKHVIYKEITIKPYFCEDCFEWIHNMNICIGEIEIENRIKADLKKEEFKQRIRETIKDALIDKADISTLRSIGWIRGKFYVLKKCYTEHEYNLIKSMPYKDFLKTVYWYIVKKHYFDRNDKSCKICKSKENINLHHSSYDHHGIEHLHLEDLIPLCKSCHAKFHDKLDSIE